MERPPTASSRPKTSSGRAPSARVRPPSASINGSANTGIQRPPSRMTTSRMGSSGPPPPSDPIPQPRSSMGQRPPSNLGRIPTSMGGRPITGMARPPSSMMRPVTQQGLRAPSRLGTAGSRQVFDKSYFIGVLRAQINSLNVEIAKMKEKKEKGERSRNELHAHETRAQTMAMEIRDLQGKLVDLNVILDRMHMNGDMSDIELEVSKLKEKANELQGEVDEMFRARQEKEQKVQELQSEIDERKRLNEAITSSMDSNMKEKFEELKSESVLLKEKVTEMEKQIEEMDSSIAKYQMDLDGNPLKKKAISLQETIDGLKKKEELLIREKSNEDTPEEKKEKMVEKMKDLNNDITIIEKQIEQVKEQISLAAEELHEYDSEGETHHVKHYAQYMELLAKDHQMEDLMQNYPKQVPLLQQELDEYSTAIILNLRKLSANLKKINLGEEITDLDEGGLLLKTGNITELKELHVRLQNELITLEDMETAIKEEIDLINRQNSEMDHSLSELNNRVHIDSNQYEKNIEEQQKQLEMDVPAVEDEVSQLRGNLENLKNDVEAHPQYNKVRGLNRQVIEISKRVAEKEQQINMRRQEVDYEPIKAEALELQREYNTLLIENSGKRFH